MPAIRLETDPDILFITPDEDDTDDSDKENPIKDVLSQYCYTHPILLSHEPETSKILTECHDPQVLYSRVKALLLSELDTLEFNLNYLCSSKRHKWASDTRRENTARAFAAMFKSKLFIRQFEVIAYKILHPQETGYVHFYRLNDIWEEAMDGDVDHWSLVPFEKYDDLRVIDKHEFCPKKLRDYQCQVMTSARDVYAHLNLCMDFVYASSMRSLEHQTRELTNLRDLIRCFKFQPMIDAINNFLHYDRFPRETQPLKKRKLHE